jgi:alkylhydroperoxidase/carboxymuconolactone decarboxylase family protein YurZ
MGVVEQRKAAGITDPMGEEASALPKDKSPLEPGKSVQTELAGRPVSGPLFDFAPAINTFLQSHLFGDLFGRGILDYQSREIATLSALANIAGVDSQFKAHVGIATHVGLTEAQLTALAAVLNQRVGMQAGQRAEQALQAVLPEGGENS